MRRLLPLVLVIAAGCFGPGPVTRRPGSNILLPRHVGVGDAVVQALLCGVASRDSTRQATPGPMRADTVALCSGGSVKPAMRPPR